MHWRALLSARPLLSFSYPLAHAHTGPPLRLGLGVYYTCPDEARTPRYTHLSCQIDRGTRRNAVQAPAARNADVSAVFERVRSVAPRIGRRVNRWGGFAATTASHSLRVEYVCILRVSRRGDRNCDLIGKQGSYQFHPFL